MDPVLQQVVDALRAFTTSDDIQRVRVAERREAWAASTRATVSNALNEVVRSAGASERGIHVDQAHMYDNFESVQIRFGSIPTGIMRRTERGGSLGVERGATLVFGQSEGGSVAVARYPFCSELPDQGRDRGDGGEVIAVYEPEALTREVVLDLTKQFISWAARTSYRGAEPADERRIGFFPPRIESPDAGT